MQLHGVDGELLVEVSVDRKASIGQIIARCRSRDSNTSITEDTLQDWQERGMLCLIGRDSDMVWPMKDNYTKIMRTGPVKQWIHNNQYPVVFQLVMTTKEHDD